MLQPLRFPLTLSLALILAACASNPSNDLGSLPDSRRGDLGKTLQTADKKKGHEAVSLYLSAADLAWQQGDSLQARTLLESLNLEQATPAQIIFANTLAAELALDRKQPAKALQLLQADAFQRLGELPAAQQIRSQQVKAHAQEASGELLAAVRERIFIAGMLDSQAASDNQEAIWKLVSQLSLPAQLNAHEHELRGWLELSALIRSNSTLGHKQAQIRNWLQHNPQHPANLLPPQALSRLLQLQPEPLQRIALLLPSQDRNQKVVNAMRNGFLARYYQAQQEGQQVPELLFYDSSHLTGLGTLYRELQDQQVNLLIGPWEKSLVRELAQQPGLPVPTLALNYADTHAETAHLYQFGLSAEDEARLAAERAWAEGKRNAVIMVAAGDWGKRIQHAFSQHWQQLGGSLKGSIEISQPAELAQQLASLMHLRDSEERSKKLADTLGTRLHSQPGRRRDVDMVFLAAPSQLARQVRPTLTFQYAGDLPVYATSAVNPVSNEAGLLHDLEHIRFTEVPWLLGQPDPVKELIQQRWPEARGGMGRFYAMGADAYQLATQLQLLQAMPNTSTDGLTGKMQLGPQNRINRTTGWAQYNHGQLEVLP